MTKHVNSVEAKIICDQVKPDELAHYISWRIYTYILVVYFSRVVGV